MTTPTDAPRPLSPVATLLVRVLVPGWIIAGAAFKLWERNPQLLPKPVTDVTDLVFVRMLGMAREREVSIFSEDAETGVQLKARLDAYDPESGWVVDIKTCQNASAGAFRSALSNSGWAIQAAFYRRVMVLAGLKRYFVGGL